MKRRIVTIFGGTGFIGRNLIKRLAKNGDIIRVVTRDIEKALFLKTAGEIGQVVPWQTNVTKPEQVASAVEGADVVINAIGILYESRSSSFQRIHVATAASIATAATAAGVSRFIQISALGADVNSESSYARSKAAGEAAVLEAFPKATIFRPSVVFGPDDRFFNMFASLACLSPVLPVIGAPLIPKITLFEEDEPIRVDLFGRGGPKFQIVYVGDVAEALVRAAADETTVGKTYQLGGPKAYSYKEIMELVREQTGRKFYLAPLAYPFASFYAWFLEFLPKPLLTCDQVTLLRQDNLVEEKAPGVEALGFEDLGITPHSAEIVLPTYLHRFRRANKQGYVAA